MLSNEAEFYPFPRDFAGMLMRDLVVVRREHGHSSKLLPSSSSSLWPLASVTVRAGLCLVDTEDAHRLGTAKGQIPRVALLIFRHLFAL